LTSTGFGGCTGSFSGGAGIRAQKSKAALASTAAGRRLERCNNMRSVDYVFSGDARFWQVSPLLE